MTIGTANFDLNQPLDDTILKDPENKVTQTLIYIYTMETTIYKDLNHVSCQQYEEKLQNFGPYIFTISKIIKSAFRRKKIENKEE